MLGSLRVGSVVHHSGARFVAGRSSGGHRRTPVKLAFLVLFLFLFVFFFARVDGADLEREDRELEADHRHQALPENVDTSDKLWLVFGRIGTE